jgi:cytochrome c oxidase accessory protein FixG
MNAPEPTGGLVTPDGAATQKILLSADVEEALYEVRRKIYPRAVRGWFAGWRWSLVCFTQLLFYGTVWLTWNGRQAVLFDLAQRKFYIFGLVLWPQDFIYLTALLVIAALSLFLFTAVAGRLFCGYACPQTVYTEIFLWIERRVEGDRGARIKLDQGPKDFERFAKKAIKHSFWIVIALFTGLSFVGYFTPIRTLIPEIWNVQLGPWESFWILFYSLATYGNAGFLREQVCKYMCPYARFQSAMFDRDTMIITYDRERGEPRGGRSRKSDPAQLGLGSCVDCDICVQVCPTGIDIRNGLQYECIGCAACADACDQVMDKMGYARGLIRYSTENALINHWSRRELWKRVARPRTLIYAGILSAVVCSLLGSLALRVPLKVDVIRDRGALARLVDDGVVENVYTLRIMNTQETPHRFRLRVSGVDTIAIASAAVVDVPGAAAVSLPVRVQVRPGHGQPGSNRIVFEITAVDRDGLAVREKSAFLVPR